MPTFSAFQDDALCTNCNSPKDSHAEDLACPHRSRSRTTPAASSGSQEPSATEALLSTASLQALASALAPILREQLSPSSREPLREGSRSVHFEPVSRSPREESPRSGLSANTFREPFDDDQDHDVLFTAPIRPSARTFIPPSLALESPATFDPDDRVSRALSSSNQGAYHEYCSTYSAAAFLDLALAQEDPAVALQAVQQVLTDIIHPRLDYLRVLGLKSPAAAKYVAGQTTMSTESMLFSTSSRSALRRFEARELSQLLPSRHASANAGSSSGQGNQGRRQQQHRPQQQGRNRQAGASSSPSASVPPSSGGSDRSRSEPQQRERSASRARG